ncbi:MAG: tyrosine-type recombinase/integrase [Butyrivibrio sp.]|nr:tyrosine-type recombinase/integrase [Butyrivibrio sp.]
MLEEQITDFTEYLKYVKKASGNTVSSYERDLQKLSVYLKRRGVFDASYVTEDKLSDYFASLYDEQFAASSISRHVTSVKGFFRYLLENGNIKENPSENIKSPRVSKNKPRVLSSVETQELLSGEFPDNEKGIRDRAILELMYATGIKSSEVISLRLSDIDMGISCLRLKKENEEGIRLIPYGKKAKDALSKYLLEARPKILGDKEETIVFLNYTGTPLSRQGLWKIIKENVKRAGIKTDVTPFTFRHSFAVNLLESGADISAMQEMMGYSESNTLSGYAVKKPSSKDPYEWARIRNIK